MALIRLCFFQCLELAQHCQGVLAQAQQQVRVLEESTLKAFPGAQPED
ncbi:MAG: hypothetical protein NT115_12325 [Proteobacteria bacterium]|nr:hypothetical protein [Pseudomonadota bacterium]